MLIISPCGGFVNHLPFLRLFRQLLFAEVPPYSLGGLYAYVMVPDESTVSTAKDLISQVVDGKNPVVPETSAAGN